MARKRVDLAVDKLQSLFGGTGLDDIIQPMWDTHAAIFLMAGYGPFDVGHLSHLDKRHMFLIQVWG